MKAIDMIKKNIKLYIIMGIIILLGTIGVTVALTITNFKPIGINAESSNIKATISYTSGANTAQVVSNGNMLPIADESVTHNTTDPRVLKVQFKVTGVASNPTNSIYDIALYFDELDCELRTKDLRWRLYKNSPTQYIEGNLSPTFDIISDNRLVLTKEQQKLTTSTDTYIFLLWISESCTGDITKCDSSMDQSKYLNKKLNANIKIEVSTGKTKKINRVTGEEGICN